MKKFYLISVSFKVIYSDNHADDFSAFTPLYAFSSLKKAKEHVRHLEESVNYEFERWSLLQFIKRGCFVSKRYKIEPFSIY